MELNPRRSGFNRLYSAQCHSSCSGNITLYAQWGPEIIPTKVIYHSNFGSDTICRVNIDHQNEVHTIKAYEDTALPANEGKTFLGWNTKADLSGDFLAFTDIGSGILLPEIQLDAQNEDNENHLYAVWGDIKIKKTGNKVYDNTGNYVDYTVVVTNAGNVAIASVALTDMPLILMSH